MGFRKRNKKRFQVENLISQTENKKTDILK